jgi:hypothetical protein
VPGPALRREQGPEPEQLQGPEPGRERPREQELGLVLPPEREPARVRPLGRELGPVRPREREPVRQAAPVPPVARRADRIGRVDARRQVCLRTGARAGHVGCRCRCCRCRGGRLGDEVVDRRRDVARVVGRRLVRRERLRRRHQQLCGTRRVGGGLLDDGAQALDRRKPRRLCTVDRQWRWISVGDPAAEQHDGRRCDCSSGGEQRFR